MKRLLFLCLTLLAIAIPVRATDVSVAATTINGFSPANIGTDVSVTVTATNGSPTVTSSAAFRSNWIGLGGFRVTIGGTAYTVAYVTSASSLTLTGNFGGSTGSATATFHKWVEMRIYSDRSFQPLGASYMVQPGTPGSSAFYKRFAASIVNVAGVDTLYVPAITIDATTDAAANNTARYTVGFYNNGTLIQYYDCNGARQLAIPPATPTSWTDICSYNAAPAFVVDQSAYTKPQIDARFPSCASGQMLYFAATGQKISCLTVGSGLSISGGSISASGSSTITVGSTAISGGTTGRLLYDNAGTMGELIVGTGLSISGSTLNATGGTVNSGTINYLAYYAATGTAVSQLALGSTLTISGGTLSTTGIRNAVNALDYGADPTGVSNSTTAISNWITACQAAGARVCYLPGGTYLTDAITQSINGLRLVGDGREKSILKARVANNPIVNITSANYAVNFTIDGIGFLGQGKASGSSGHCVSISDSTGGTAQFVIRNASFTNCGGKGLYIPYMFAGRFENNIFDEIGDNHMEIQGGSATVIDRNDFKTLEANKVALWVYSGNPVITGNNGIEPDSGSGTVWGRFGRSTSEGDSTDSYVLGGTFAGNNVEDFKSVGWQFRTGSGGSTYAGNTFISPSSGTVTAMYYYFLSGTELGIWSGGTFTLQGTAAWTNSQPVHSRGYAPFYVSGTNTPTSFYEWNAAEARSVPYIRPKLLAGTTANPLTISEAAILALYDSSLQGTLTGSTDPSGNAGRILLQDGTAARPTYSFGSSNSTGMYYSSNQINWTVGGTLRALLNSSYEFYVGDNSTGTGKITSRGSGGGTGFYVRTASVPGLQGGLVMPFEGGGLTFGPGVWWSSGAYNSQSGFWLSNGLNWQSASSTHSQWKIRKSTGTSTEGDIVLNLHPDDGYVGFSPYGTSAGNTSETRHYELAANGSNYVGLKAADSIGTTRIYTLPSADGSSGQTMQTDGAGVLSFGNCCGGQYSTSTGTGTQDIDWTTVGTTSVRQFTVSSNASVTFTFSNARSGQVCVLIFIRDATGSAAVNWPASTKWPGGTPITPTAGAAKKDVYTFVYDGSTFQLQGYSADNS